MEGGPFSKGNIDVIFEEQMKELAGTTPVLEYSQGRKYEDITDHMGVVKFIRFSDGREFVILLSGRIKSHSLSFFSKNMECIREDIDVEEDEDLENIHFMKSRDLVVSSSGENLIFWTINLENEFVVVDKKRYEGLKFDSVLIHSNDEYGIATSYVGNGYRFSLSSSNYEKVFSHSESICAMCEVKKEKNQVIFAGGGFKGYDFTISKCDIVTKKVITRYRGQKNSTTSMITYINSKGIEILLTAGNLNDEVLRFWNITTGEIIHTVKPEFAVWNICEMRKGCILLSGYNRDYKNKRGNPSGVIGYITDKGIFALDSSRKCGVTKCDWVGDSLIVSVCQNDEVCFSRLFVQKIETGEDDLKDRIEFMSSILPGFFRIVTDHVSLNVPRILLLLI